MKVKYQLFFVLILVVFGCGKEEFTHSGSKEITSCELCEYADKLTGTYAGTRYGIYIPNWNTDTFYYDVEHIFLNHGNKALDSTIMYFRVKSKFLSEPTWSNYDTLSIKDSSKCFLEKPCSGMYYHWITPNHMKEYDSFYGTSGLITNMNYDGYK